MRHSPSWPQSSLAQLYPSRISLLQRPFPLPVTLIPFVHGVPASQEKLSISICKTPLSNPPQPSRARLAYLTLGKGSSTRSPRSITRTSAASALSCPHPAAISLGSTVGQRGTWCFVNAWRLAQHQLEHNCLLWSREWLPLHKGQGEKYNLWGFSRQMNIERSYFTIPFSSLSSQHRQSALSCAGSGTVSSNVHTERLKNTRHFYLVTLWPPLFAIILNTTLKTVSHTHVRAINWRDRMSFLKPAVFVEWVVPADWQLSRFKNSSGLGGKKKKLKLLKSAQFTLSLLKGYCVSK